VRRGQAASDFASAAVQDSLGTVASKAGCACGTESNVRTLFFAVLGAAALWSSSAEAGHRPYAYRPYIGFGYGLYGPYSPYYSPWYGPSFGVGIHLGDRYPAQRVKRTERTEQRTLKLYVYPAAGQSDAQRSEDRYQCHTWAADQSGHDPTLGAGNRDDAESYTRAFTACMEGRNYVVK
jgi:hypothetical protein